MATWSSTSRSSGRCQWSSPAGGPKRFGSAGRNRSPGAGQDAAGGSTGTRIGPHAPGAYSGAVKPLPGRCAPLVGAEGTDGGVGGVGRWAAVGGAACWVAAPAGRVVRAW